MGEEFGGDFLVFGAPAGARLARFARRCGKRFVPGEEFLDLHRVVRERFGRGVDRGEPAADHHHRQSQLHVRQRVGARRAGELQRHQEVARGAHAARQPVRDVERRGLAGAERQRDVIEAQRERVVGAQRAAEAHATHQGEALAPFEQQPHQLQEVLVPAHGDAVFGHAAEAGHHPVVQRLVQRAHVVHRLEGHPRAVDAHAARALVERLDLQAVDADHAVPFLEQVVREREAGGPHARHQHAVAAVGPGQRAAQVQRIPAREQRIDLEAPGQLEHVLQRARLGLRDVHRRLLLVDAGLHAVVADAMPGGRHHRVVDRDHRQRRDRVALRLQLVELGDALLERAAGEVHAERRALPGRLARGAGLLAHALRTGVLALLVAPDAVVGLVERAAQAGARVGEREAFATPQVPGLDGEHAHAVLVVLAGVAEQAHRIGLRGQREQQVAGVAQVPGLGGRGPRAVAQRNGQARARRFALRGGGRFVGLFALPGEHRARERKLVKGLAQPGFDLAQCRVGVEAGQLGRRQLRRLAPRELQLDFVERVELAVALAQRGERVADAEERADEGVDLWAEFDQQRRLGTRIGRSASCIDQALRERGVGGAQRVDEREVEPGESFERMKVFEAQAEGQCERGGHWESCGNRAGGRRARPLSRLSVPGTAACRPRPSTARPPAADPSCG